MPNASCSGFDHTEHLDFVVVLVKPGVHQLPGVAGLKCLCEQWPSLQITVLSQKLLAHMVYQYYISPEISHFEGWIQSHTELNVTSE